jgi:flavin reductase (DIM6/NTAB) family NADH-FMN oxidoreductase RutF
LSHTITTRIDLYGDYFDMSHDFEDVRLISNFYQSSSFFPMPVVLVSTLSEEGQTNLGPYSLCFPHLVAERYAMMLICREDSNTAENIKRTGVCAINFIPDDKKFMENTVELGWPGDTTEEKMKRSIFNLLPSMRQDNGNGGNYPEIVKESIQVFECTWDQSSEHRLIDGCDNFVLDVDHIFMKKKYKDAIVRGMDEKSFPSLPIDWGFRDNLYFWFAEPKKPYKVRIPEDRGTSLNTVTYAAKRYDPSVTWDDEACAMIMNVPRVFLKRVFKGVVGQAKAEGITHITPEFMQKVQDKRSGEKNN